MQIPCPTIADLRRADESLGIGVSDVELESYRPYLAEFVKLIDELDGFATPPPAQHCRAPGYRPGAAENPLNAWYWKCEIEGAETGPLAGRRVAIKDAVCVAGVPMMNGSFLVEGYVPEFDATVVSRILEAGGEIAGKATCEDLCLSGGSNTAATGLVRNPHDPTRGAGGSSSGSAALVAAGECDMAIGGDQGGSIRIPSAMCGVYGLKPTYGLVPYTGAMPLDMTLDHLGPMARNVRDVATLLDAIAGPDGRDPRQRQVEVREYAAGLEGGIEGLRIGLVEEGFAWPDSDAAYDEEVRTAAKAFEEMGATVVTVSVPWHRNVGGLLMSILTEGLVSLVFHGRGIGSNFKGWYGTSIAEMLGTNLRAGRGAHLSHSVKLWALLGQHLRSDYHGRFYSKAQNLVPTVTAAYDRVLEDVDLLAMPTTQTAAPLLPPQYATIEETLDSAFRSFANTGQFDLTGHPAMNVPCGRLGNLPVGMMLVGPHRNDDLVLRAAYAFEQLGRYDSAPPQATAVVA
jgi:amidase